VRSRFSIESTAFFVSPFAIQLSAWTNRASMFAGSRLSAFSTNLSASSYFFSLFAILPSIGQAGRKSGACLVTFARNALASSGAPFCTLNCANLIVSGERTLASLAAFSNSRPAFSLSFLAKYSAASAECAPAKLESAAIIRGQLEGLDQKCACPQRHPLFNPHGSDPCICICVCLIDLDQVQILNLGVIIFAGFKELFRLLRDTGFSRSSRATAQKDHNCS